MSDCTEALVKIKLAFRPGVVDLPEDQTEAAPGAINLANFNEFDMQLDMAMPFALDQLPAPDQWMAAASQTVARRQDITLLESEAGESSVSLSTATAGRRGARAHLMASGLDADDEEEEGEAEDWAETEFDPNDEEADLMGDRAEEEEEEEEAGDDEESIELARDADGSSLAAGRGARGLSISGIASEGRASLSASKASVLGADYGDDLEPLAPLDDEDGVGADDGPMLGEDGLDMDEPVNEDFDLGGYEEDEAGGGGSRSRSALGELSPLVPPLKSHEPAAAKAKTKSAAGKKPRKRRMVVDKVTELTRDEIKANLKDTTDIVRRTVAPRDRSRGAPAKPIPCLADRMRQPSTQGLAPELMEMFSWTMRNDPLPFRLRRGYTYAGPVNKKARRDAATAAASEGVGAAAGADASGEAGLEASQRASSSRRADESGSEAEGEDVEHARQAGPEDAEVGGFPEDDFNFQDEEPYGGEDEAAPFADDEYGGGGGVDFSAAETSGHGSFLADAGKFELGAVNDIAADANYEASSAAGDDDRSSVGGDLEDVATSRSAAQWHPHTKKVMAMLENQLETKETVSYNGICGVSRGSRVGRRTAAGVFFEILQLKTWDFIEVGSGDHPL